jgi:NAD(P)-dependent dehydrogenase (short-subunit alcohol dehydrogenase family)
LWLNAVHPRVRPISLWSAGGRIIQLSTVGGQAAFPGGLLYHASKWGIEGFIDAVSRELVSRK